MSQDSLVKVYKYPDNVTPHYNADTLEIVSVEGTPCIVKKNEFKPGDLVVFIPVDMLVPVSQPEFSFLTGARADGMVKIKARKLRQVYSEGLVIRARPGMKEGDEVSDALGVEKYIPPAEREPAPVKHSGKRQRRWAELQPARRITGLGVGLAVAATVCLAGPVGILSLLPFGLAGHRLFKLYAKKSAVPAVQVYDIENLRRFSECLQPGEEVVATEKIHGCHAAFYKRGKKLFCYSRTVQRPNDGNNVWSRVARKYNLDKIPDGTVLRGEIFGEGIQDLTYGAKEEFLAFDIQDFKTRDYLNYDDFVAMCDRLGISYVPQLYRGPFSEDVVKACSEGLTTLPAKHVREGVVVRPVKERTERGLGRCILKVIGEGYRLRKE